MTAHTSAGHSHTSGTLYGGALRKLMTTSTATMTQDGCHIARLVQTTDKTRTTETRTTDKTRTTETADEQHISTASGAWAESLG